MRYLLIIVIGMLAQNGGAQRPRYDKMSPMVRQMARQQTMKTYDARSVHDCEPSELCAFVQTGPGGEDALRRQQCRILAQAGDICIANIPTDRLGPLSLDSRIVRIEANRGSRQQTDSLAWYLNALPVYEGACLPQAYTGKGVVVGVMDIGFDLTHPNFYSRDTTDYRIRRFWDMLSADTVGSSLPVGRDYAGRDELLAVAHSRDGLAQTHGTHTLGIAAGSGYRSPYSGMAPESDICVVANAVADDTVFIAPDDYYKYTFATDALGFKYIFDYARSQGKPCVVSFSEGSSQDFWGYDQLYYEMLRRISGPGCILVSAAGNYGNDKTWFRKAPGEESAGTFFANSGKTGMVTLKSDRDFTLRLVAYDNSHNDTLTLSCRYILQQPDSVLRAMLYAQSDSVTVVVEAYPSCYVPGETCYDLTLSGTKHVGRSPQLSLEVIGTEADIEVYRVDGSLVANALNPLLAAGERSHSVLSPAAAPCVICVGATYYRPGVVNYQGVWHEGSKGEYGEWAAYSSVGPTMDGRTKPDVAAPGSNIISSYSSYYLEANPGARDIGWDVEHFDFNGRTYAWNSNSGTSMSCPAVAGAIALWLQAKPDLTTEQVLNVLKNTCRHHDEALAYPNNYYGYGEIDVYHGLLYILGADQIDGVSVSQTRARIETSEGRMTIDFGLSPATASDLSLFSLSGRKVFTARLPAGLPSHTLSLPRLAGGIYVVQISGQKKISGSTLVKL